MASIKFEVLGNSQTTPIYLRLSLKRNVTPRAKTGLFIVSKEWSRDTKLPKQTKSLNKNLVGTKNGNKLDCRIHNLEYRSRSIASRKRKSSSRLGYTGVYQEHKRYRAVISIGQKSMHLGMFGTPEEAALAYNQKSKELFGDNGKINIIRGMSL